MMCAAQVSGYQEVGVNTHPHGEDVCGVHGLCPCLVTELSLKKKRGLADDNVCVIAKRPIINIACSFLWRSVTIAILHY